MKKSIALVLLAASLTLFATGCGKDKGDDTPSAPQEAEYVGTVTVEYKGKNYDTEGITVEFHPSEDGSAASLLIKKIKFVPQMPLTLDITVPDVKVVTVSKTEATLSCDNVVPLAMGGEFPTYTVTGFSGRIKDGEMTFSLKFGEYPTSFRGKKAE